MADTNPGLVRLWQRDAAAYVQLERLDKANSYTAHMLEQFQSILDGLLGNASVRVVVITGTGHRAFCAGADRQSLNARFPLEALDLLSARVFQALARAPKSTLAAVNGAAVGGGLELALACDVRIASSTARFSMPEPTLGILPAAGGTYRLPTVVGLGRAKELILGGAVWDAQQAFQAGLVSAVTAPETLLDVAHEWAMRMAHRDPLAVRLAKQALNLMSPWESSSALEAVSQAVLDYHRRERGARENCENPVP